jgi:erythromycin esterase-like protein
MGGLAQDGHGERGVLDRHLLPAGAEQIAAMCRDARVVLIGESTHGTQEFYELRGAITKALIDEHGFAGIAAEADWPDALRVDRFVRGGGEDRDANQALADFARFPQWMWRNTFMLGFVAWLRARNAAVPRERGAGFYGLDLYSMFASMSQVIDYLDTVDADAAERARGRYGCFDWTGHDAQRYGRAAGDAEAACEDDVVEQLLEMRTRREADGSVLDGDEAFHAEQHARVAVNAERYYREMYRGAVSSWNIRDRHMAGTLDALVEHLGGPLVVWAHNSHVGDARGSEMGASGEVTVGGLARARYGTDAMLIGFTTSTGTVTAASDWGAAAERKTVRPPRPDGYEAVFHDLDRDRFALDLRDAPVAGALREPRLERAIGVIYRPGTERASHYFRSSLPDRFDLVVHIDRTRALEPLERTARWETEEFPETYPTAV